MSRELPENRRSTCGRSPQVQPAIHPADAPPRAAPCQGVRITLNNSPRRYGPNTMAVTAPTTAPTANTPGTALAPHRRNMTIFGAAATSAAKYETGPPTSRMTLRPSAAERGATVRSRSAMATSTDAIQYRSGAVSGAMANALKYRIPCRCSCPSLHESR